MFGIADDILIAGFIDTGREHDTALNMVLRICSQANLRLTKDKSHFRLFKHPFLYLGNIMIWCEPIF